MTDINLQYQPENEAGLINGVSSLVAKYGTDGTILTPKQAQEATNLGKMVNGLKKQAIAHHAELKDTTNAAHKAAVAAEKRIVDPLNVALVFLRGLIGSFKDEEARKIRVEQEAREADELRLRNERIANAQRSVTNLIKGIAKDEDAIKLIESRLEEEDCGQEEAEALRGKLEILTAKLSGKQEAVNTTVAKAEESVNVAVAAPATAKTTGAHGRKNVTVEVVNLKALCRAVADGSLPIGCVKADLGQLKKLHQAGMDIKSHGCKVNETSTAVFR